MTANEIKFYRSLREKKNRYKENLFLSEGEHLAEEILKSEAYKPFIRKFFFTSEFDNENLLEKIYESKIDFEVIPRKTIERISESKTPQDITTLIAIPPGPQLKPATPSIALDNINDPGNLGTILRIAYWFGIYNIFISDDSADVYNSKVLRASQGAVFQVKVFYTCDLFNELISYTENDVKIFISDLKTDNNLNEIDFPKESIFVFGNESHGIQKSILNEDRFSKFRIKPHSDCESLNVASAVAITLNEFRRKSG